MHYGPVIDGERIGEQNAVRATERQIKLASSQPPRSLILSAFCNILTLNYMAIFSNILATKKKNKCDCVEGNGEYTHTHTHTVPQHLILCCAWAQ